MKYIHSAMIMDVLEAEILAGGLPPGSRLSEAALAERFGVSRTPVREALQSIVSRSLAERVPYRGVLVREFDLERINSMFEAMAEIEALCGGLAARRATDDEIARLESTHIALTELMGHRAAKEYEALNSEFHAMIYTFSGNVDLSQMAFDMRLKLAPFRKSQLFRIDRLEESNREHGLIVGLIAARNRPGVETALREHLRGAARSFFAARQEALEAQVS